MLVTVVVKPVAVGASLWVVNTGAVMLALISVISVVRDAFRESLFETSQTAIKSLSWS